MSEVKKHKYRLVKLSEEEIQLVYEYMERWVQEAKHLYENKTTDELLEMFTEESKKYVMFCVDSDDDIRINTLRRILLERGLEEEVHRIDKEAEEFFVELDKERRKYWASLYKQDVRRLNRQPRGSGNLS